MDGGSGNASGGGGGGGASTCCYYALLGIRKNASATDIRAAYRRLAMKWHPDRWASDPGAAGEAKWRFQRIQEAYSVLSDKGKKAMYDAGLFDPLDDDDQDFSDFMQEMLVMMDNVKNEVGVTQRNHPPPPARGFVIVYQRCYTYDPWSRLPYDPTSYFHGVICYQLGHVPT